MNFFCSILFDLIYISSQFYLFMYFITHLLWDCKQLFPMLIKAHCTELNSGDIATTPLLLSDGCILKQRKIGIDSSFQRFSAKPSHGGYWTGSNGSHYQYAATVDLALFAFRHSCIHLFSNSQCGQKHIPAEEFKML